MSAAAWASVAIATLALAYAAWTRRDTRVARHAARQATEDMKLAQLADNLTSLARSSQEQIGLIRQEMRDDRAATDHRLRYLEEHLWRT